MFTKLNLKSCAIILLGSAFLAFGLYHVHSFSGVTEGGVLGMSLLLEHWLSLSPAVSGFLLNGICYAIGLKLLGKTFLGYSMLAAAGFSISYKLFEQSGPLWPKLADMPFAASITSFALILSALARAYASGTAQLPEETMRLP